MIQEGLSQRRRKIAILAMGGGCYALAFAWGSQIDAVGHTALGETLLRFAFALPVAVLVLLALLEGVPRLVPSRQRACAAETKPVHLLGVWALIFCCYVPMLLIEFPGSFTYDTQNQVVQVAYGAYDTFHPLLHTLLIRLCIGMYDALQSFEWCALLYSLIQMTLVSLCFALIVASIARVGSRRAARVATAFFCLYPNHMFFACNCTKDVLFSAAFALFVTYSVEALCVQRMPRMRAVVWAISGVAACLLRNNMIYALVVWLVVLLCMGRACRRLLTCGLLVAVLTFGVNEGLIAATHAGRGDVKEMLSVPIQQLARTYRDHPEAFADEDMTLMDSVFPDQCYRKYAPTLADHVKYWTNTEAFLQNKADMVRLWARLGMTYPGTYLDAFLQMAHPFLYPYARYTVIASYIELGLYPGTLTEPFGQPPIIQPSRFAALRAWLKETICEDGADAIPVVRWLFNMGLLMWAMLFCVLRQAYAGNWSRFAVLMLPVLLWGTYLLGPVMQGRYAYPFVCLLPVLCVCSAKARGETAAAQKSFTEST